MYFTFCTLRCFASNTISLGLLLKMTNTRVTILLLIAFMTTSLAFADNYHANTAPYSSTVPIDRSQLTNLNDTTIGKDDIEHLDEIWKGVSSSFDYPYKEWESKTFLEGLSGNIGYHHPISQTKSANLPAGSTQGPSNHNTTSTLSLKYPLLGVGSYPVLSTTTGIRIKNKIGIQTLPMSSATAIGDHILSVWFTLIMAAIFQPRSR